VNDVYGYAIGNQVLRQVADVLVEAARGRGKVYRLDGAKFALCLGDMGEGEARAFYGDLQRRVRTCVVIQDRSLLLSISGGAMFVDETVSGADTVRACISYAKRKSRAEHFGELVFFHHLEQDKLRTQLMLQAIRQDVLEGCHGAYLYYQPLIDPATGRVTGMEALLRWRKEPYGDLLPGQFIQWLEEDDCFFELGRWIFRQALTDGKKLVEDHPGFMVSVNVTYSQLERDDFRAMLEDTLAETGFPPENLYIELTERSQVRDMAALRRELDFLCAQGIQIALDDFGTGTASLNLLRELPISCLKIDRTYLMNIRTSRADEIIVSAVIGAARRLGIRVCLEGVENQEIKDFVSRYQVSTHQGFYYARPMPIQCLRQMAAVRGEGATAG
jgi:EAL domain-containing protein (putative c-di-GMP-specific phosphodiesterase class I)